jgi:hypothetical protein
MEVLTKRLVTATEGATTVNSGGLNRLQIIKVARAGIQHDFTAITNLSTMSAREWTFLDWSKRVVAGEKVFIMYKVVT